MGWRRSSVLSDSTQTYAVSYRASTAIPGAVYTLSPSSVTVAGGSSEFVRLTLTINPKQLTKTIDPTVDSSQGGLPRQFVADASGLVLFTGTGVPTLRVPVYSAPRPASRMTQAKSLTLPNGSVQKTFLPLSGEAVDQGSGATLTQSTVAGFELAAKSGVAPACTAKVTDTCTTIGDDGGADLRYIGVTSNATQVRSVGGNLTDDGLMYISVTTQGPWRSAVGYQEFDVPIDLDGDGVADAVTFTTRLTDTDILVDETVDLANGDVIDAEPLNDSFGDTDTAIFDSDTLVMPISIGALGLTSGHSRVSYGVESFSDLNGPTDQVGVDDNGDPTGALSFDPLNPGLAIFGSYDGDSSALLYRDSPGSVLEIRRDAAAYAKDGALGALLVHFQNTNGNRAQVVALKSNTTVGLTLTPNPATRGKPLSAVVTVANTSGSPATGGVVLSRIASGKSVVVARGDLKNGKATLTYTPHVTGKITYQVNYGGSSSYNAASARKTIKVN